MAKIKKFRRVNILVILILGLTAAGGFLFFAKFSTQAQEVIKIVPDSFDCDPSPCGGASWLNPEAALTQDLKPKDSLKEFNVDNSAHPFEIQEPGAEQARKTNALSLWAKIKGFFKSEAEAQYLELGVQEFCRNGQNRPCGSEVGQCRVGIQICQQGAWGECIGAVLPSEEICDGVDNNCNGEVDELSSCLEPGSEKVRGCSDGQNRPCGSEVGQCQVGVQVCERGIWSQCIGAVEPGREICDWVDNDCDGEVDEGGVCFGFTKSEKTLTFSGFGVTSPQNANIKFVQLRLSLAGRGQPGDELLIEYHYRGLWRHLDNIKLEEEVSNDLNGGYFLYGLPIFENWQDLSDLKVRFTSIGEGNIFLDAIWLEAEYDGAAFESSVEARLQQTQRAQTAERGGVELKTFEVGAVKEYWKMTEEPEFEIEETSQGLLGGLLSIFQKKEISAVLVDPQGAKSWQGINIDGDMVKISLLDSGRFRPGRYKLNIKIQKGGKEFIQEEYFYWGVLAVNVNKSIYLPNENAYLQIAALDDRGQTICDADLQLEITPPIGAVVQPAVKESGKCGRNNVTDVPDYSAHYLVNGPGVYQVKLTNADTGYEITDSFEVRNSVPFDVERVGPTRIYPLAIYEMHLRIKVHQDFQGQVIEKVPSGFKIIPPSETPAEEFGVNQIVWGVDWKAGQTYELFYKFDAPDISPYLYLLGPLSFEKTKEGAMNKIKGFFKNLFAGDAEVGHREAIFWEARQWQISSDNPTTRTIEQQINIIDQEYSTTTASFWLPEDNRLGLISWDSTRYSDILYVYFEAVVKNNSGGAWAGLHDSFGGQVANSTVYDSGDNFYVRKRSQDIKANLSDGTNYTARIYLGGAGSGYIQAARLIIVQSTTTGFITDTETQVEVGNASSTIEVTNYTTTTDPKIYLYDSSKFTPTPSPIYFEATMKTSSAPGPSGTNTYYFNAYDSGTPVDWANNPGSMTDGSTATFADNGGGDDDERLTANTCDAGCTAQDATSTISKVEIRIHGCQDSGDDGDIYLTPYFSGSTAGDRHDWLDVSIPNYPGSCDWSGYFNITSDTNAPVWTWADIQSLDVNVRGERQGGADVLYASMVEVRVTHEGSVPGTVYSQLISTDGLVTVGEISTTSTSWVRHRSSDISGSLTSGKEYVVQVKTSDASLAGAVASAKLIFDQSTDVNTGIEALETYSQYVNTATSITATSYASTTYYNLYNPDSWASGDITRYFEATMKTPSTIFADLATSSESQITNSEISTTSASYVRHRSSSALTINQASATNTDTRAYVTAGTGSISNSWLIHQVTNLNRTYVAMTAEQTTGDTGNAALSQGETGQWLGTFGFQADLGNATMTDIVITLDGTADPTDVDNMYLYWDTVDSAYDGTEPLFDSSAVSAGSIAFSTSGVAVNTTKAYMHIVFDIASGAVPGNTTGAKITNNGDIDYTTNATSTGASITTGTGEVSLRWVNQAHYRWRNDDDAPDPGVKWSDADPGNALGDGVTYRSLAPFSASSTSYLYVSGGSGNVWRTKDGLSWENADPGNALPSIGYMSLAPFSASSTSYLYVSGGSSKVWRTKDGLSWENADPGNALGSIITYLSLVPFSASSTSYLYVAGTSGNAWRTKDGLSWENADPGNALGDSVAYWSLVPFSASSTSYLYVAGTSGNVWRTKDGLSWENADPGNALPSTFYLSLVPFSASSISYLYVSGGSSNVWRTKDGLSWENADPGNSLGDSADYYSLAPFSASSTSYLYVAGDAGNVWRTGDMASYKANIDTAITNQAKSENVRLRFALNSTGTAPVSQAYRLQYAALTESNCESQATGWTDVPVSGSCGSEHVCMAGSDHFSNTTTTGAILAAGTEWSLATTSLPGGSSRYNSLATFSVSSTSYLYTVDDLSSNGVYRTRDGTSWEPASTGLVSGSYYVLSPFSASSTSYLYVAGSVTGDDVYRTRDGTSWEPASTGLPNNSYYALSPFSASSTSYLYVAGSGGSVYRTRDGTSWEPASTSLPYVGISYKALAPFSASSTSYLYVAGSSGNVYRTKDGLSWENVSYTLYQYDSLATFDVSGFSYLYVAGINGGVKRTRDGLPPVYWEDADLGNNIPTAVSLGAFAPFSASSTSYLYVAGSKGSVYRTPQYEVVRGYGVEDTANETPTISQKDSSLAEVEYNFQFTDSATDNGSYCLRASDAGSVLDQYEKVAKATLAAAGGNSAPVITNVQFHGENVAIDLNEWTLAGGGTYIATTTFTVTDVNTCSDVSTTTLFVYHSAVENCSTSAQANVNNCYPSTSTGSTWRPSWADVSDVAGDTCARTSCSGNNATFWCTTSLYYTASSTDSDANVWYAFASTSDVSYAQADRSSNVGSVSVELNTLQALEVSNDIGYAQLSASQDSGQAWVTTTVTTTGNIVIDVKFHGGSLTKSGDDSTHIPAFRQQFTTTSNLTYSTTDPVGEGLITLPSTTDSFTGDAHDLTMVKATNTMPFSSSADNVLWGVSIPSTQSTGSYASTTYFVATGAIVNP